MHRVSAIASVCSGEPSTLPVPIVYSAEVARQVAAGPSGLSKVVALESTIISHGMPYPQNVECARELESIVRAAGAVPATIAVLDGVIHVGLTDAQLEMFGKNGRSMLKCSRRDLSAAIAGRCNAATTVSGTILIAQMVGIEIMATGGIGGVHRGGEVSMDVSADLTELGRTRVLVVCAGVKSILDIPRTLEYLETQGVAVFGFGTNKFPAFFTRDSGSKAPLVMEDINAGARYLLAQRAVRSTSGGILAVPLPASAEADGIVVGAAITKALAEATAQGVSGRDITPFLLKRVNELTKGKSLSANLALVKNNTRVAAEIAVAYHKMLSKVLA